MNKEIINLWMENVTLDEKVLLDSYSSEELELAFSKDLEFGTGGMRGILGLGTNRLNIYTIRKATIGLAQYLNNRYENPSVVIGHDNRHGGQEFKHECAKVLSEFGIKVYLFDELIPTPIISFAVRDLNATCGINITASHNPKNYNGYKVYDHLGIQLLPEETNKLIELINKIENVFEKEYVGNSELVSSIDMSIVERYSEAIKDVRINQVEDNVIAAFSPVHGAGSIAVELLNKHGFNHILPVENQMTPDPDFSCTKSSNPEEKEAFESVLELAKSKNADLAFVVDPDADRLGCCYNNNGEFIFLTGNELGSILLKYIVDNKPSEKNKIFKTVVTGDAGAMYAIKHGFEIIETLTGFKYIGDRLEDLDNKEEYVFGYEESYGYLITKACRDKDSISSIIFVMEVANYYKSQGMTLGDVLNSLYNEVGFYEERTIAINLGEKNISKIAEIMSVTRKSQSLDIFSDYQVLRNIDYLTGFEDLPKEDVLKYFFDFGWVVFRPSGTEPKIKFYVSVKADSRENAINKCDELCEKLDLYIKSFTE